MCVQVRMYAVHSEYEVVVSEKSSAQRYMVGSGYRAKGDLGVLPHEILKKIIVYVASGAI